MSLKSVQILLARLLTDEEFRESFLKSPAVPADLDITPEEFENLKNLQTQRIQTYASMLYEKRVSHFTRLLPVALLYLGEQKFWALGRRYCAIHVMSPSNDSFVYEDTKSFVRWVHDQIEYGEVQDRYLKDILHVDFTKHRLVMEFEEEAALHRPPFPSLELTEEYVLASRPSLGKHVEVMNFPYDVIELFQRIKEDRHFEPDQNPTWLLLAKTPGKVEVKSMRINQATAVLLHRFEGRYSVSELFDLLGVDPIDRPLWLSAIYGFYDRGLIRLQHDEEELRCVEL